MSNIYKKNNIPQNYLAEEILLGIIIIYPEIILNLTNILRKEYFFLEFHSIIYTHIIEMISNKKYSTMFLINKLEDNKIINETKGYKKIVRMMRQSQLFINFSHINNYVNELINILHNIYIKRLIIQYGHNVIKLGYGSLVNNKYTYNKLLLYIKFIELEINNYKQSNRETTNIKELLSFKLLKIKDDNIDKNQLIINQLKTVKSGFHTLDSITNGLPKGNLIVIAGRPSVGKTSLAINIAYKAFILQNISICFFSLEMSSQEIINRIISVSCNLDIKNQVEVKRNKWRNITQICEKLLENNIYINNKYNIDIQSIEHISRNLHKSSNTNLIIIDYLQLIELSSKSTRKLNRSQELGYITRKLKLLAQSLKLPIIILSQLNRNIEIRNDKEPLLSDLRESGCIDIRNHVDIISLNNNITTNNLMCALYPILLNCNTNRPNSIIKKISLHNNIIYLSHKHLFTLSCKINRLYATYNHKYLSKTSWIRLNKSIKYIKLNSIIKSQSYKSVLLYQNYLTKITYINCLKTYDININNEFHFLSDNLLLHNSIEQDSDIILILQHKKTNINQLSNNIIDIRVSKNRNGKTGTCEIQFIPETTTFRSIQ